MDLGRVRAGDRTRFSADALPGRTFDGRVEFVYPTVSSETRTVKLRIALENSGGDLRPGMYGRVTVTGAGAPTLVIPGEAVVNTGESNYVFLARAGGHFEPRMVSVGVQAGDQVQVLKGGGTFFPFTWPFTHLDRVQIAGVFGWPQVPSAVHQAALLIASDWFKLKDAPWGVAGMGDFGVVKTSPNPWISDQLRPYIRGRGKVGV